MEKYERVLGIGFVCVRFRKAKKSELSQTVVCLFPCSLQRKSSARTFVRLFLNRRKTGTYHSCAVYALATIGMPLEESGPLFLCFRMTGEARASSSYDLLPERGNNTFS